MKLGIATLAASTVVLAGCTAYFARELARERERNATALVETGADTAALHPPGTESAAATPTGQAAAPAAAPVPGADAHADAAAGPASVEDKRRASNREKAAEFLRLYDNPETRAKLLEGQVNNQRRIYSGLRSELDLDGEHFDRFLNFLAEYQIDRQARMARCLTDTFCLRPDLVDKAERRQSMVDLIGEANTVKFEKYGSEQSRSGQFGTFQARLGPNLALSPQQLDELAQVLHDEQTRTRREIESHGHETNALATRFGVVVYSFDTKTVEERMASAAASLDRLRDRAGMVLNSEQLAVFNQMQDDQLLVFRPFARVQIAAMQQGFDLK